MVMVAPGNTSPDVLVIFPLMESWADATTGNSKAAIAANKFFKITNTKVVKPSAHQGKHAVHLTYYLSLRRHYPDQVHVSEALSSKYGVLRGLAAFDFLLLNFDFQNNGFDLSLSFSLIAQSKAPP